MLEAQHRHLLRCFGLDSSMLCMCCAVSCVCVLCAGTDSHAGGAAQAFGADVLALWGRRRAWGWEQVRSICDAVPCCSVCGGEIPLVCADVLAQWGRRRAWRWEQVRSICGVFLCNLQSVDVPALWGRRRGMRRRGDGLFPMASFVQWHFDVRQGGTIANAILLT